MAEIFSLKSRRRGVVTLYIFSFALLLLFLIGKYGSWNAYLVAGILFSALVCAGTFHRSIVKPGIWKLYRSKSDTLDEREKGVVLDSIKLSYSIFGVVSLLLLFLTVLSVRYNLLVLTHRGHFSLGMALVMFLDFLVASLPPSVIAWTERIMEN